MDNQPHGGHIASLLFAAFQILAPELIERGFWSVVVPPYYRITFGKNIEKRMYMRERSDLPQWCARHIFNKFFQVEVDYRSDLNLPGKVLDLPTLEVLTDIVFNYGLLMDNLSAELSIPPELLEALCRCTHYLSEHTMDTEIIKKATGSDAVAYHQNTNLLVITFHEEDITIPLIFLRESLYGPVMRTLNRIGWTLWQLYITTKRTPTFQRQPISLYHLYQVFKTTRDSLIEIEPLKGLGSMSGEDLTKTCLDIRNRKVLRVTSVGDMQRTLSLMEKDSAARKQLGNSLSDTTLEL